MYLHDRYWWQPKRKSIVDKEQIYNRINADEELTDSEKREAYECALEAEEWDEREADEDY